MQFQMILFMRTRFNFIFLLMIGVSAWMATGSALATNLDTTPLPREREVKNFEDSNEVVPNVSKFHRRLDYREEEKAREQEEKQAQQQATDRADKERAEQLQAARKHQDEAVGLNNKG